MTTQTTKHTNNKSNLGNLYHKRYPMVIDAINAGNPVFLYGEAGTGKNHMVEQAAKEKGLPFTMTNAILETYKLAGMVDAHGTYHPTAFYKAWTEGGIFFLDEFDGSNPEAVLWINAALANKYAEFPGHTELVWAHPDFIFVAGGNSNGFTHDDKYARSTIDAATLDRFAVIHIDYDEALEENIYQETVKVLVDENGNPNKEKQMLAGLIYRNFKIVRQLSTEYLDGIIVSTRALSNLLHRVKTSNATIEELFEQYLFKGRSWDKYKKDMDSSSFDVKKHAGQFIISEAKDWTQADAQNADWVAEIMEADVEKFPTLLSFLETKLEVDLKDADLLKIPTMDIQAAVQGTVKTAWARGGGQAVLNTLIRITKLTGNKYKASIITGSNVVTQIQEGTVGLLTWNAENQHGIGIDSTVATGADDRAVQESSMIHLAKIAEETEEA